MIAAHLIVWHHLAFYGPLSDSAHRLIPGVLDFLYEYGRMAVQVFFVVGGYLIAASLDKRGVISFSDALRITWRRYLRLAGPYLVALTCAIVANWLASRWMTHESISAAPTLPQLLAHALFLQEVLGYEPLSAGTWYLAIDFQLGLLVLVLTITAQRLARRCGWSPWLTLQGFVWLLAVAALFVFNRDSRWEDCAIYFFGSYALGIMAWWTLNQRLPKWAFWLYALIVVAALAVDWRPRLLVSLSTAASILVAGQTGVLGSWPKNRWVAFLGATSYSLFLIHFPVCLVVNAILSQYVLESPLLCIWGMLLAYLLSVLASAGFYLGVERRLLSYSRG